jgi:hypothetical protein
MTKSPVYSGDRHDRAGSSGLAGLLRDKTRAQGKKLVAIETVNKVLALTQR